MKRVTVSIWLVKTFFALLTSRFMVVVSSVVPVMQVIGSASAEVTFINKWGSFDSGDGGFIFPCEVTVSGKGDVYVADHENNRIQRFDACGNSKTKWANSAQIERQR